MSRASPLAGFQVIIIGRFWVITEVGVPPGDPLAYVTASALLAVVALLACYIPAPRAMRFDPMVALRYE